MHIQEGNHVTITSTNSTWKGKQGVIIKVYDSGLFGVQLVTTGNTGTLHGPVRRFSKGEFALCNEVSTDTSDNTSSTPRVEYSSDTSSTPLTDRVEYLESKIQDVEAQIKTMISILVRLQTHIVP